MRTLEAEVSWRVDVTERLERQQSAITTPTDGRMAEAGKSLGDDAEANALAMLTGITVSGWRLRTTTGSIFASFTKHISKTTS